MTRSIFFLLCAFILSGDALAADPTTQLDTERFRPAAALDGGAIVDGAGIGAPWQVDMALWFHGQRRPVTFVLGGEPQDASIRFRIGARLGAGLNFWRIGRLSVDLPIGLYQEGVDPGTGGDLPRGGVGDLRLTPHVVILDPARRPLGIAILAPLTFPTGKSSAWLGEGRVTFEPRVVLEHRIDRGAVRRFALSGSGGFHLRPRTVVRDLDSSWEVTLGASFRWLPTDRLVVGTELSGAFGQGANARHGEWNTFAGLRFGPKQSLELLAGGSVGLGRGIGTPEGRLYASFRGRVGTAAHKARAVAEEKKAPRESKEDIAFRAVRNQDERVTTTGSAGQGSESSVIAAPTVETGRMETLVRLADPPPSAEAVRGAGPPIPGRGTNWDWTMVSRPAAGRAPELNSEVLFDTASAALRPDATTALRQLARWLLNHDAEAGVIVEGHADPRGATPANDDLSQRRAQAVADALLREGVRADRIEQRWFGERRQRKVQGTKDVQLQANRRVLFTIRAEGKAPTRAR